MRSYRMIHKTLLVALGGFLLVWSGATVASAQDFAVVSIDLNEVSDVYCFNFTLTYDPSKVSGVHVLADEDPDAFLGGENPFAGCTECEFPKLDLEVNESVVGPTVLRCDIDGDGNVNVVDVQILFLYNLGFSFPYDVSVANARPQPVIETDDDGNPVAPNPLSIVDVQLMFFSTLAYPNTIHIPKSPIVLGRDFGDRINVIFSGWVPFNGAGTVMDVTFNVVPGETPAAEDFDVSAYDVSIVDPVGCAAAEPYDCGEPIMGASLSISGVVLE